MAQQHSWHSFVEETVQPPENVYIVLDIDLQFVQHPYLPQLSLCLWTANLMSPAFIFFFPQVGQTGRSTLQLCVFLDQLGSDNAPAG